MNKRPAPLTWVSLLFLILITGCELHRSPDVFEKHFEAYPDIRKKYIYQSVLRLANIKQDPNFDKLIKDVEKITIYFPPREDSTYEVRGIRNHIREEGYEELIAVRTANKENLSLWVNESLPKPHYVGFLDTS